ncbi:hypothetical protein Tco_0007606 [Tanacetum coccineum]
MGMTPINSSILLNTKDSLFPSVVQEGASSSPKSIPFTLNTDLVIPSLTAILAILQLITALAVARNPLPTSKGGPFSYRVVSQQDELPSSVGLDFRARIDGGRMYSGHLEAK